VALALQQMSPSRLRRAVSPIARPIARRLRTGGSGGSPRRPSGWAIGPPDFIGVGAQRAGTTWWYGLVCDHPEVHRAVVKECQFFDPYFGTEFTSADVRLYQRQFPRPPGCVTGEWSPRYMHDFWTAPLLRRAAPDAKILVLLRDPLERYLSGLRHEFASLKRNVRPRRRRYVRAMEANDALERSLYGRQLARLFACFDRAQVLVLQYERCREAPAIELRRTHEFLGVEPRDELPTFVDQRAGRLHAPVQVSDQAVAEARRAILEDAATVDALVPEIDLDLWPSCRDRAPSRGLD
jgi:sulfotransferase family protein